MYNILPIYIYYKHSVLLATGTFRWGDNGSPDVYHRRARQLLLYRFRFSRRIRWSGKQGFPIKTAGRPRY